MLSSLNLVVILLGLAGCSSYEPKINTGAKAAVLRTPPQIMDDFINASLELEKVIFDAKDPKTATEAVPKMTERYGQMKTLVAEEVASLKHESPDERQKWQGKFQGRMELAQSTLHNALAGRGKVPGLPGEFTAKAAEIDTDLAPMMQQVADVKDEPAPAVSADFVADSQPDSSSWLMWLLCLLILAVCGGFLYRDGLWSNAIRLVNVIFAGLLAMNFYERLAKYLTNFSDDIHSYVAFFDFLALWALFVLFIVVFRALTESVSKVRVRFLKVVDQAGGIVLSLCVGWVMVCFTLTSLHAAPLAQYPLLGSFQPQNSMFLGLFAPDREWLGFTKYQSQYGYCRAVSDEQAPRCVFPSDFIVNQFQRRQHIEKYIRGNPEHAIRVNKQYMQTKKPGERPGGG